MELTWRPAPRPRRPGHQALVQRRRQWCWAAGAASATPGSGAGAAAHGTAAGFAKLWAALTRRCSCGSLVGLMLDVSQTPGRCPVLRRHLAGRRGTAPQASLELSLALLLICCQRAVQPLVQLTVPQGQKLVLVTALPWCETALAGRIPVSKPLSRGKGPPLLGESFPDSAPARSTRARRAAPTTSPASCDAAASAGGSATACGRARRAVASPRIWTVT
jgi:hypothetical protein